ncbi:hypothetical protein [Thermoplasma volcanium GSS1]|uniref:DUF72 domain-containing protein n=1 Tax=Thermoplasma volcanium (strain ATCC 51530 / DSM 4299 / JCM 9571 / NBRC 15438 / GSS1) TaxID=273116 RepID=Q97BI2_THEVO|nr:DUF72 domain-containing protein [Thermoplasma volcanium]BAB59615.1 hypothetical protein [Thermoplasma volcanium GSS1]
MVKFFIGCSGWFYLHWKGRFYPEDIHTKYWFRYYSSRFNTVELNSTFYRFPSDKTALGWYNSSPENFTYSLKINRSITHIKRLRDTDEEILKFYNVAGKLKEKLGCLLFQFPPSFKYSEENVSLIAKIPLSKYCRVLEFRHKSWFDKKILSSLVDNGFHIATVSSKDLPFLLIQDVIIYMRMHGDTNGYATDYPLEKLKDMLNRIIDLSPDYAYIYFNNDYNGYAPKNAEEIKSLLLSKT